MTRRGVAPSAMKPDEPLPSPPLNFLVPPAPLLFARPPAAAGAVATLQAKRDLLARRVEGLIKCKNEFQELARLL